MMVGKRATCWNCGADMGPWDKFSDRRDTCGNLECERESRNAYEAERFEAHEQLDRDMGWY